MHSIQPQQIQQAYEAIKKADRILIVAHQKPDGDTSGSSLALWHWLDGLGKLASIFCRHELPDQFLFMPNVEVFRNDPAIFEKEWDLIITCDSGDLDYAGVAEYLGDVQNKSVLINFDHHASNKLFADINVVNSSASSTAEVLYTFFEQQSVEISQEMAVCLMTGVFTDTSGFSNAATNHRSLEMASAFVRQGASIQDIHRATIANKNIHVMKLWGKVWSRLRETERGVVYTYILKSDLAESGLSHDAIDGISNYLSQIKDVKAVIVFAERENRVVKLSMRTYDDEVDLSELALAFGGGGHKKAAGCTIPGKIEIVDDQMRIIP